MVCLIEEDPYAQLFARLYDFSALLYSQTHWPGVSRLPLYSSLVQTRADLQSASPSLALALAPPEPGATFRVSGGEALLGCVVFSP